MKFFIFIAILLASGLAKADEKYQTDNVIGDWFTFDGPFIYDGVHIEKNDAGYITLYYCDLQKLRFEHKCQKKYSYDGVVTFNQEHDSLNVLESSGSSNPSYEMKIDKDKKDRLIRTWGREKLVFFRG